MSAPRRTVVEGRTGGPAGEGDAVSVNEKKDQAQEALFEKISAEVKDINQSTNRLNRAAILRDLALAYRYASGASQPGSVTVEK